MHERYRQNSPTEISNKFFATYKKEGAEKAVDYLFATNKFSADSKKDIDIIKDKFKEYGSSFGDYSDYELVSTKMAGKDLELLTFIVKHDRLPLVFKLLFYKFDKEWRIQNFTFNTDLDNTLTEVN